MSTRKNQSIKMYLLLLCVGIIVLAQPAAAKSVYFSADHNAQTFDAWNIGSTGLVSKQGTYNLQYAFNPAGVAIDGLTGVDPVTLQPLPPLLFVTTEGAGGIEMINAVTLEFHGVFSAPINMGGLDADDADNILYAIQRGTSGYGGNGTSNLFIYTYNDDGTGMAQVANITLPNHGYGMSLALDDSRDILWVGDIQYNMVKAYDVDVSGVWSNIAEIPALSFSVSHVPVDVAVDSKRNIVYTSGSWYGSPLLSKYEVETGVETTTNCGGPLGLAVDEYSGYVYMTRFTNDLAIWDCSTAPFILLQDTPDLGSPAGIAIANGVGVNPLNLAKNFAIQGEGIWIGETFTYEITCDNVLNPTLDATGVKIRDDMPVELDYVSETVDGVPGTGVYDPVTHTVFWDIGTIPAGGAGPLVKLVVHVNDNAAEGMTINNFANIWGDDHDTTTVDPQPDPDCDPEFEICDPGHVVPPPCGDIYILPSPMSVVFANYVGWFTDTLIAESIEDTTYFVDGDEVDTVINIHIDTMIVQMPPFQGYMFVGGFSPEHPASDLDFSTVRINDTIVPIEVSVVNDVPVFPPMQEVLFIKYNVREFILHYGWVYDFHDYKFSITGSFTDETPYEECGMVAIRGHISGDINSDGIADISDLTMFISYLFQGQEMEGELWAADVNHDSYIDISDLTLMVAHLFN